MDPDEPDAGFEASFNALNTQNNSQDMHNTDYKPELKSL